MFKVKLEGINGVKAQFQAATKDILSIIDSEIEDMAANWVAGAKRDAPADQGTLRQGISYVKKGSGVEIFSSAFYSPFMEFGTKGNYRAIPGTEQIAAQFKGVKGGDIMQMLRMIVRWVHRKGITGTYSVKTRRRTGSKVTQYAEDYAAAWPILMSILKHGVKPHPFFFKQQEVVWPRMISNITRRLKQSTRVHVEYPGNRSKAPIITI